MFTNTRPLYSFLATLLISSASLAQEQETTVIAPLAKDSVLLDTQVADFMIAVGERGHVLLSEDGENFTQLSVPTQATLTAVSVVGSNIWVAGHDAIILHSPDKGETWTVQYSSPELERPFLDIHFFDEQNGIAVGAYGLFYRTENGGLDWTTERHAELLDPMDQEYLNEIRQESEEFYIQELESILPHLNRLSASNGRLYMAGETGLLATSDDRGKTWTRQSVDYFGSFFDIQPIDTNGTVLAVGLRGNAFVSTDAENWSAVQTCTSATLNSLVQLADNRWLAVGNNGVMTQFSFPIDNAVNAYEDACSDLESVVTTQTPEKNALLNVVTMQDKLVAVTSEGLQLLNLE